MFIACSYNHSAVVERLLAHPKTDVNQATTDKFGVTPLSIACQWGYSAVVAMLLAHGASVSKCLCSMYLCRGSILSCCCCCIPCCVFSRYCCMIPTVLKGKLMRICNCRSAPAARAAQEEARSD